MLVKIKHLDATYALLNTQIKVVAEYAFFLADGTELRSDASYNSNDGTNRSLIGLVVDVAAPAVKRAAPNYRVAAKRVSTLPVLKFQSGPYLRAKATTGTESDGDND